MLVAIIGVAALRDITRHLSQNIEHAAEQLTILNVSPLLIF
jgi:hypothetical protein